MMKSQSALPDSARERKLDDLFGDQPYLSATMKARRLHDSPATGEFSSDAPPALLDPPSDVSSASNLEPSFLREEAGQSPRTSVDVGQGDAWYAGGTEITPHITGGLRSSPTLQIVDTTMPPPGASEGRSISGPAVNRVDDVRADHTSIPIARAAAYLRAECPSGAAPNGMEQLQDFRTQVLLRWLKHVPARGAEGSQEE